MGIESGFRPWRRRIIRRLERSASILYAEQLRTFKLWSIFLAAAACLLIGFFAATEEPAERAERRRKRLANAVAILFLRRFGSFTIEFGALSLFRRKGRPVKAAGDYDRVPFNDGEEKEHAYK